jgi:arabinofuranan 3-O-arabinosyltransferase
MHAPIMACGRRDRCRGAGAGEIPSTIVPPNTAPDAIAQKDPRLAAAPSQSGLPPVVGRVGAAVIVLAALVASVVLTVRHPDALVTMLPLPDMRDLHVDFDTFWHSAVALTQGGDIYATGAKLRNLNPPLLSVLLTPFAAFDALTAYRIWMVLTLLMVVGSIWAVARELRLPRTATALALVAVIASSPVHGTLVLGQIYPLLLVGLVAGWIAQRHDRPLLGAVLLGATVALKPSLAPILLLPAVLRRWPEFRAGIYGAAGASLLGVAIAGPSSAWAWLRIAFTEGVPNTVDNASIPGLAVRFAYATGIPPVITAVAGMLLGAVVLVGTLLWLGHRRADVDPTGTAMWAVIAASLLFSPIAWHNYLMLLWPGMLILLARGRTNLVAVAFAVALIPVSWNAEWPPDGVGPAVARSLYCVILLGYWWSLSRSAVSAEPSGPASEPAVSAAGPASDGRAADDGTD